VWAQLGNVRLKIGPSRRVRFTGGTVIGRHSNLTLTSGKTRLSQARSRERRRLHLPALGTTSSRAASLWLYVWTGRSGEEFNVIFRCVSQVTRSTRILKVTELKPDCRR
jgi:hypothetical protein